MSWFSINRVILGGNVSQDPELRYTGSGTAVCSFSLATNRSVKKGDQWQDVPTFHKIVVWQKLAEWVAGNLTKGSKVTVEGRLETRSYEDKNGVKKSVTEVVAESLIANSNSSKGTPVAKSKPAAKTESEADFDEGVEDMPF